MAEQTQTDGLFVNLPTPAPHKSADYLHSYTGWVYSASSLISTESASIELKLYKRVRANEYDVVDEHEALNVLYRANDTMTLNQLRQITDTYLLLLGEGAWYLSKGRNGDILEIYPLRPDWIQIKPDGKGGVKEYLYSPGGSMKSVSLPAEDVIFFKDFDPINPYRGYGKVRPSAMSIDIDDFSSSWNRNFFYNSAIPYMILSTEKKMTPQIRERFMESFQDRFGGVTNSHKVALIDGGEMKVENLSTNMKEMDYLKSKEWLRDSILASFHISKANLGITDDVNRATQEATDARFMRYVIKPRVVTLVNYLNEFFLPLFGDDSLFFNFEDPVPEDQEVKLSVYKSGLELGWLTRNEVREREGLEPVEGGDDIYLPFNQVVLGQGANSENQGVSSSASDDSDMGEEDRDETEERVYNGYIKLKGKPRSKIKRFNFSAPIPPRSYASSKGRVIAKQIKPDLVKLVMNIMESGNTKAKEEVPEVPDKAEISEKSLTFWKELISYQEIQEKSMKQMIVSLANEQEKMVLDKLNSFSEKGFEQARSKFTGRSLLFSGARENKRWLTVLSPFIAGVVRSRIDSLIQGYGFTMDDKQVAKVVADFLRGMGTKFVSEVNEVTREKLIKTIEVGLRENEAPAQLRKRITDIYDELTTSRAENISRTETMRGNNYGSDETYKQQEVVIAKQWLTAPDERRCPYCGEMEGKIVDKGKVFFKEGDSFTVKGETMVFKFGDVGYPPLHPQCRCTLIPVTIDEAIEMGLNKKEKRDELIKSVTEKVVRVVKRAELEELEKRKAEKVKEIEELITDKQNLEEVFVENLAKDFEKKLEVNKKKLALELKEESLIKQHDEEIRQKEVEKMGRKILKTQEELLKEAKEKQKEVEKKTKETKRELKEVKKEERELKVKIKAKREMAEKDVDSEKKKELEKLKQLRKKASKIIEK